MLQIIKILFKNFFLFRMKSKKCKIAQCNCFVQRTNANIFIKTSNVKNLYSYLYERDSKKRHFNDSKTSVQVQRSHVNGIISLGMVPCMSFLSVEKLVSSLCRVERSRHFEEATSGKEKKRNRRRCLMRGMKYFRKPLVKLDVVKARIFALWREIRRERGEEGPPAVLSAAGEGKM